MLWDLRRLLEQWHRFLQEVVLTVQVCRDGTIPAARFDLFNLASRTCGSRVLDEDIDTPRTEHDLRAQRALQAPARLAKAAVAPIIIMTLPPTLPPVGISPCS
jgi:hypothetical protein